MYWIIAGFECLLCLGSIGSFQVFNTQDLLSGILQTPALQMCLWASHQVKQQCSVPFPTQNSPNAL